MNIDNVSSSDIPSLQRLDALIKLISKLTPIAEDHNSEVIYQGKTWHYEDLVCLAYEYYSLSRHYGLKVDNIVNWLDSGQNILKQHNLPWPLPM